MKRNKSKDKVLEELKKVPIIQVACEKTGISRNTFYRWKKEIKSFSKEVDKSMEEGVALMNDITESQLLSMIKDRDFRAISFWLRHRNDNYKNKIEVTTKEDFEELSPSQINVVKQALKLAKMTQIKSIKNINKKYESNNK
ncbi:MAG: phBC6A51 family helix-turn-helix protein [Candidatus Nomurabacteria bacterium]